jgi:PAS domain S-box-containing protein
MAGLPRDPVKTAAHFAAIVDSSDDAIVSKDLSGIIESWNKSAERIFGYTSEEAIGQSILLIIPPDLRHEEEAILARLRQGLRVEHFETTRRHKDGSLIDISLTISPILDEKGKVIGASKIARDIRIHKQAQRAIAESQNRLAIMLGSIGDAVLATDTQGRVTFVNPVGEKVLGYTHSELIGRQLEEVFRIVNEETRRPAENPVDRVMRDGGVVGLANHTVLLRPDGKEVPIDDSAAPIHDADGQLVGVVLVFRDVTEKRRTARIAALLSDIVSSSDDAIISKDLSGTIMSWNEAAERLFGYTAQEVIGQSVRLLIPPDRQGEEADILRRISQGQRINHYETVRRKKNGQLFDISLTISPLRDSEGRVFGASKIARDITEQKRTQRVLYETQERLRVTLESIGDGVIATDINGHVTFANSVALKLTGRTKAGVINRPLAEVFIIINETNRQPVANPIERVIREGVVVGLANHTLLLRPDGTEIPIADSAAPIMDANEHLIGVVLVFRDSVEREKS